MDVPSAIGWYGNLRTTAQTAEQEWSKKMDDLISRKDAIGRISTMFAPTPTQKDMVADCLEILDSIPTIDAVPIIRCKDCKNFVKGENESDAWEWCFYWHEETEEDGYCHMGEMEE